MKLYDEDGIDGPFNRAMKAAMREDEQGAAWKRDPRAWLAEWYATMRDVGHDGFEFLSTEYGGAHAIFAMIAADLGVPGAAEHLQRQVALYALHLTRIEGEGGGPTGDGASPPQGDPGRGLHPGGRQRRRRREANPGPPPSPLVRLVMPGCRSVRDEVPELTEWARYMLGEDHPERPRAKGGGRVKAGRELALARRLDARRFIEDFEPGRVYRPGEAQARIDATLATVRSAVGTLVHRRHERGFVSYFETGPRCFNWPISAVVCVDGQEPIIVRPPTKAGKKKGGKGAGEVWTFIATNARPWLYCEYSAGHRHIDLAPLGALVRETRIPAAEPTT